MTKFLSGALALLFAVAPLAAFANEEGAEMPSAQIDLGDTASLQRGAGLFMNYCSGCHSLGYQRYSRVAEDLGLTKEQVEQNLIYGDAKIGDTMDTGMDAASAEKWIGKAPPDLSVVARTKEAGADWIYNYLKSFYVDESRPLGWNNTVFPNASMPNPLWELQGMQHALTEPMAEGKGCERGEVGHACFAGFEVPDAQKGKMTAEEFDAAARDIAGFLAYVGEPAAMHRQQLGVWVVLFLGFFTLLAYLLKLEYWRDVH